ncbi:MAG: response regulator transcription factor [Chloroflexi bacterium]|uniref:Response regulator transcription factor n=1 Tax=Candidatus Chlorohelix allophototropha TaxID=3003348 RepID=A0A8T7M7Z7_9CHLR|nr:response regulator transcription factor [Chloroflexota bacterium]WJW68121.1 response regulator transcription factor [Chloroflexota bacterium L227-S17]
MATDGNESVKVLIVDDHAVVRQGLITFLELQDEIEVVGEASNGKEALQKVKELHPDVVLMDLVMPVMDGLTAIKEIKLMRPETEVIALTSFADDEKVFTAIRSGATGYLLKDVQPQDLVKAVLAAERGEVQLHPEVAKKLMHEVLAPPKEADAIEELTEREREVLGLLGKGMSNKEIARDLSVSEKTVKAHVSSILNKLNLPGRTHAALYAVKRGIAAN